MAETLTDVDQFDASIQMPTAGETVSAADMRDKNIQRLANRTYNLKLRIDQNDLDIAAAEADIAQHDIDIAQAESDANDYTDAEIAERIVLATYSPSPSDASNVSSVSPTAALTYTLIGPNGSTGNPIVRVEFILSYTSTGSGAKSFRLPVPTTSPLGVPVEPESNFASANDVIGMGVADDSTGLVLARVFASTGEKKAVISWNSTAASGSDIVQGYFVYRRGTFTP